jgi:hypothetical protein
MKEHVKFFDDAAIVSDLDGKPRIIIQMHDSGPLLALFHVDGSHAGALSFSPTDGAFVISLLAPDGTAKAGIALAGGAPVILHCGPDGTPEFGYPLDEPPPTLDDFFGGQN